MTAANAKYTPGPWYADDAGRIREEATDFIIARTDDGGHVSGLRMISEEAEATNARLIAAAPDLVEALKSLLPALLPDAMAKDKGGLTPESRTRCMAIVKAALSKAGV